MAMAFGERAIKQVEVCAMRGTSVLSYCH